MVRVIEETGGTHLRRLDCEKRAPGIEARSESSLRNVVMKREAITHVSKRPTSGPVTGILAACCRLSEELKA
jgi:hypothetical protein